MPELALGLGEARVGRDTESKDRMILTGVLRGPGMRSESVARSAPERCDAEET